MPDRRETMGGYTAHTKIEYPDQGYFTIPDYRLDAPLINEMEEDGAIRIPAKYEVCGTCRGHGSHVNPAIDSHGITQSEMEELGDDFREGYFRGDYDVTCAECEGKRVVLEPRRDILTKEQAAVLEAWEKAIADEGQEIYLRNKGYQF